ncbi:MAG: hypothetical protein WA133_07940 [Syntrophales bacterium]
MLPKREYNAKGEWRQRVVFWVTGWFYDDIKDIIEICRVAAYLNHGIHRIAYRSR